FQAQGRRPVGAEDVQEFFPRESQAAHAGVHLEVDGQGRGAGMHEAGCHEDGVPRGENGDQVQFLEERHVVREDAAHHQDRGGDGNLVNGGIQISVISVSFFLRISSTLVMYESVSFWSSSWAFLASSSGIWEAFWPFLISSCTSRRMLRMWTRTSSAIFFACFASSLRRSSVSGGIGTRWSLQSFVGVRPRSEARIAFSMSLIILGSNGWTVRSRFSGAASEATCLRGVGVP